VAEDAPKQGTLATCLDEASVTSGQKHRAEYELRHELAEGGPLGRLPGGNPPIDLLLRRPRWPGQFQPCGAGGLLGRCFGRIQLLPPDQPVRVPLSHLDSRMAPPVGDQVPDRAATRGREEAELAFADLALEELQHRARLRTGVPRLTGHLL